MVTVFVDGSAGTTGLRIFERLQQRQDVTLMPVDEQKKKDPAYRREMIHASDVTFLCLPDAAATESAQLADTADTIIIDASTAHRTTPGWAYGFAELSQRHRDAIASGNRIAVPGCHASGFIALVYPLIAGGVLSADALLTCFSLTGYSGGGKSMMAQYEQQKDAELYAPRQYGLTQMHKHLKEMKAQTGLYQAPVFCPIVDDYVCGMQVSVPVFSSMLNRYRSPQALQSYYDEFYAQQALVRPTRYTDDFLSANTMAGKDSMQVGVVGNEERMVLIARFDNLGKGASGAAVQCMNLALGLDEATSLSV